MIRNNRNRCGFVLCGAGVLVPETYINERSIEHSLILVFLRKVPFDLSKMHKTLRRYNSLIVLPYSMKQIPFTVPQHTTPPALRHDRSEENFSSEPSSPSSKRPSVEIPGKFFFPIP